MTNVTALHVVRPIGDDWRCLVTPGGFDGVMPAGRHTFEIGPSGIGPGAPARTAA